MSDEIRTVIGKKLYLLESDIKKAGLTAKEVYTDFRVRAYNEMGCRQCPLVQERHHANCNPCDNYGGRIDMAIPTRLKGKDYLAFPLGARAEIESRLGVTLVVTKDLRKSFPMSREYKLLVDLYDGTPAPDGTTRINQKDIVRRFLKKRVGVISAPARGGKTVLAVAISIAIGERTLIIADKIDLLRQFRETYVGGSPTRVKATNIPAKRVIVINKIEDFDKPHDVALISYRKFIRETADARILKYLTNKYGFLVVDEVHMSSAPAFAAFLLKLGIPYRLGLSATPKRKDGRYRITNTLMGRVVINVDKVGLKPLIKIHCTRRFAGRKHSAWHLISKMFIADNLRNEQIVELAYKAIEDGHKAVLIPLDGIEHINDITERLNDRALQEHRRNRNLPEVLAVKMSGKTKNRDKLLARFDNPECDLQFLVVQRSIIRQGVDLARPSCVICAIPMSGKFGVGAPLFEQLSWRGSTPFHNKKHPEVYVFADSMPFVVRMIEGLLEHEVLPNSEENKGSRATYKVDHKSVENFHKVTGSIAKGSKRNALGGVILRR